MPKVKKGYVATRQIQYGENDETGKQVVTVIEKDDTVVMPEKHLKPLLDCGAVVGSADVVADEGA
jgi:hypothetical protein